MVASRFAVAAILAGAVHQPLDLALGEIASFAAEVLFAVGLPAVFAPHLLPPVRTLQSRGLAVACRGDRARPRGSPWTGAGPGVSGDTLRTEYIADPRCNCATVFKSFPLAIQTPLLEADGAVIEPSDVMRLGDIMRKLLHTTVALSALLPTSMAANAADVRARPAPYAPPPPVYAPPPFSWTGFYLGGNIGGPGLTVT
jgi:hypothetical protein